MLSTVCAVSFAAPTMELSADRTTDGETPFLAEVLSLGSQFCAHLV